MHFNVYVSAFQEQVVIQMEVASGCVVEWFMFCCMVCHYPIILLVLFVTKPSYCSTLQVGVETFFLKRSFLIFKQSQHAALP